MKFCIINKDNDDLVLEKDFTTLTQALDHVQEYRQFNADIRVVIQTPALMDRAYFCKCVRAGI